MDNQDNRFGAGESPPYRSRALLIIVMLGALGIAGIASALYQRAPGRPVYTMSDGERVAYFREILFSGDYDDRRSAAQRLADFGDRGIVVLVEGLKSRDADARKAAAMGLAEAGEEGGEAAIDLLFHDNPETAAFAAWVLGQIGNQEFAGPLSDAAHYWLERYDPDAQGVDSEAGYRQPYNPTERPVVAAVKALGALGNPYAAPVLTTIADGRAPRAREAAEEALAELHRLSEPVPSNLDTPEQMKDRNALISALRHNRREVRLQAVRGLRELGDPSVCEIIRPLLDGEDIMLRSEVIDLLGAYRDQASVDRLIQILEDDVTVSSPTAPIRALGEIGDAAAVPCLVKELESDSPAARQAAAIALGQIGDSAAVDALIEATMDASEHVRGRAAEALGLIGDPRAIDAVAGVIDEEHYGATGHAIEALGRIGTDEARRALEKAAAVVPSAADRIAEQLDEWDGGGTDGGDR